MEADALIGVAVVAGVLGLLVALVAWSRRRIDQIARNGFGTPREILKDRRRSEDRDREG